MIWDCFAYSGPGQFAIIKRKTNSQDYHDILRDHFREAVRQLKLSRGWWCRRTMTLL